MLINTPSIILETKRTLLNFLVLPILISTRNALT